MSRIRHTSFMVCDLRNVSSDSKLGNIRQRKEGLTDFVYSMQVALM